MLKYYHHHHLVLVARISQTLSRHFSLSFNALGRSSGQHPVSSHSCWMYVRAGRPAFARPCVGVHKSTSLMSSSLLLQQCRACLFFFFFYYPKCADGLSTKGQRPLSCTQRGPGTNIQWKSIFLPLPGRNLPGYITYWTPTLFFIDTHLQLVTYTVHMNTLSSNVPIRRFTLHFRHEHLRPVYFRYQVHFLLFSFNLGMTSAAASTDVKRISDTKKAKVTNSISWNNWVQKPLQK